MGHRLTVADELWSAIERLAPLTEQTPKQLALDALTVGVMTIAGERHDVETQSAAEDDAPRDWKLLNVLSNAEPWRCRWPGCGRPVDSRVALVATPHDDRGQRAYVCLDHVPGDQIVEAMEYNIGHGFASGFRPIKHKEGSTV